MEIYATFKGLNRNLRVHFYMSSSKPRDSLKWLWRLMLFCAMSGVFIEKRNDLEKESGFLGLFLCHSHPTAFL